MAVYAIREVVRVLNDGWRSMRWKNIERDTWVLIAVYCLLMGWAVVHTTYEDHEQLLHMVKKSNAHIPDIDAKVTMTSDGTYRNRHAFIVVGVEISNPSGPPRALRDWAIKLSSDRGVYTQATLFLPKGDLNVAITGTGKKISLNGDLVCANLERPIPTGGVQSCWIGGLFKDAFPGLYQQNPVAVVSFVDVLSGKVYTLQAAIKNENSLSKALQFSP